jgi:hypothetical protein
MMGDRNGNTNSGASGSMLSLLAGAALGAAGLGWWLLAEAEQRRQGKRQARRQGPNPPPWKHLQTGSSMTGCMS